MSRFAEKKRLSAIIKIEKHMFAKTLANITMHERKPC